MRVHAMSDENSKWIHIRGARTHNLRDISLSLPRDKLIVVTGLSGSGKSSLAFDTIYAEGQRKYVESLSAYARQFLGQMVKPDIDQISGLPPTIAISQQSGRSNPRSTVATTTEIYDYLRLLFARVGTPHCPKCGRLVHQQTVTQIVDSVLALPEQSRVMILAPLVRGQKGEHKEVLARVLREGFVRVRVDGEIAEVKSQPALDKNKKHAIEAVVDRLIIKPDLRTRLSESIETSLRMADGLVVVAHQEVGGGCEKGFSHQQRRTTDQSPSGSEGHDGPAHRLPTAASGPPSKRQEEDEGPDQSPSGSEGHDGPAHRLPTAASGLPSKRQEEDEGPDQSPSGSEGHDGPAVPHGKGFPNEAGARKDSRTRKPLSEQQESAGAQWHDAIYSERYSCTRCGISLPELEPRIFSFNSPHGACPKCDGLGTVMEFDPELVVPDPTVSLEEGAIDAWHHSGQRMTSLYAKLVREFCEHFKVSPVTPYKSLPQRLRDILMRGTNEADEKEFGYSFEGVIPNLDRRWNSTESESVKSRLHAYLSERPCTACKGARLRPESLAVRIGDNNIDDVAHLSIDAAAGLFSTLKIDGEQAQIAGPILREIRQRLQFMIDVGIGYLTLNRTSNTLSGGESQRIRLATQVGSGLVGVCYVLDEPTIGLHQSDNAKLIATLRQLVTLGNTVIVVEHDVETIHAADWIVDIGPGAGAGGGRLLVNGPRETLMASPDSITAKYLRGELAIEMPEKRRRVSAREAIEVKAAAENNLKSIDVRFPLGVFCCVTGVSGSGKSTLVNQTLLPALKRRIYGTHDRAGAHERLVGAGKIDKVIEIDQSPIGRTPRSNPATYTGVFDMIRELYAKTREAKLRGYGAARFSFNVKGGRCEACQGQGTRRIEMHFLPDIFVECGECKGTRYGRETLEIRYRGKSIADVLAMRAEEALPFFDAFTSIKHLLQALCDVGLDYIALGQSSTTLSGGEAQRVKLAAELGKPGMGHTLYVLDEPTTGLHFADIHKLLDVLNRLCNLGHSIIVIEHNLDVIKQADWIIDLGPEGGEAGGRIVAEGTPEEIAACERSYTGQYLSTVLRR
jgi:excinuclease ABC subunit A